MTITDRDIRQQVTDSLHQVLDGIDLDGIVREITGTYGLVGIETISHDAYWTIVARHDGTQAPQSASDPDDAPQRYTTMRDVIDQAVAPAISEGTYDLEAIAREAFEWRIDTDAQGRELLDTGGFEQVCSVDEFWEIVQRHEGT